MAFFDSRRWSVILRTAACFTRRPWALTVVAILTVVGASSSTAMAAGKFASMLVNAETGQVLNEVDADDPRYPASLTKMMTLYMAFEAIDRGLWDRRQSLWVSAHAASQAPTKLGLRPGQTIELHDAVLALVTKSANDAAAVIAENLAGTESTFAARMTTKARALGMSRTTFRNASGLPDPDQITTARDMATLAMALLYHFPHHYHYFGTQSFYWRGRSFANHNNMLHTYYGVDGIKTGYTRASGFNLVASAQRDGRRLLGVVLGAPSPTTRSAIMGDLFDQAFLGSTSVEVSNLSRYVNTAASRTDTPGSLPTTASAAASTRSAAVPTRSVRATQSARSTTAARAAPRSATRKATAVSSRRAPAATRTVKRAPAAPKAVAAKPVPRRAASTARVAPARPVSKAAAANATKVTAGKPRPPVTKSVKSVQKVPPPAPRRTKVTAGRTARPS